MCMFVPSAYLVPKRTEEIVRSHETGVRDGYEPPCDC